MPTSLKPTHSLKRTVARFALDGPVLPLVTETLPLAEQLRRSLLVRCKDLAQQDNPGLADAAVGPLCPAIWGKDEQGRRRTGHEHAFFLPADEDGDGRIDHLTVWAPMGFNALEQRALQRLRYLFHGDGGRLPVLLIGVGSERDFRAFPLAEAVVWVSATPFVVTRYPKLRGRKRDQPEDYTSPQAFVRHVFWEELDRLRQRRPDLPEVRDLQLLDRLGSKDRYRCLEFKRFRRKRGDDGGRRPNGAFRIRFTRPVRGPLCLGHSSHFGLGLFVPAPAWPGND